MNLCLLLIVFVFDTMYFSFVTETCVLFLQFDIYAIKLMHLFDNKIGGIVAGTYMATFGKKY